jgi:hypothetical protein
LHLYVTKNANDNKIIEIQLRSTESHNWATLVEIIDLVYDKKIKEGQPDNDFERFHLLMSKVNTISLKEKKEIISLVNKYDIFANLRSIFVRNYLEVRKRWLEIQAYKKRSFFVIEAQKDSPPLIDSFSCFPDAEAEYFERFRQNNNANILLTCVPSSSYEYISKAYSNYILTMHAFLEDFLRIIANITEEALKEKKVRTFYKYYKLYINTIFTHNEDINKESNAITSYLATHKHNKEVKLWKDDFRKRFNLRREEVNKFSKRLEASYPKDGFKKILFDIRLSRIASIINKRTRENANQN